jgi:histidine triad (HIT) family protein
MNAVTDQGSLAASTTPDFEKGCIFCERLVAAGSLASRLIYEDGHFHVSHQLAERGSTYLGLARLQTKRHVRDLSDLNVEEARALGPLLSRVSRAVESCTGAAWTYCYSFLEGSRHLHILITARYPNVPKEYVRLDIGNWPAAPQGGPQEVADLAQRLRAAMGTGESTR